MCITAFLSYFLITVRKTYLKKFYISDILTDIFVKGLTADDKNSLRESENLPEPIQMQLSKKLKTVSQHFAQFVQSTSNFKHFEKMMILVAYVFSKLATV